MNNLIHLAEKKKECTGQFCNTKRSGNPQKSTKMDDLKNPLTLTKSRTLSRRLIVRVYNREMPS